MPTNIEEDIKEAIEGKEEARKKAFKKILEKKGHDRIKKIVQYALKKVKKITTSIFEKEEDLTKYSTKWISNLKKLLVDLIEEGVPYLSRGITPLNDLDKITKMFPKKKSKVSKVSQDLSYAIEELLPALRKEVAELVDNQGKIITNGVKYVSSFGDKKSNRLHHMMTFLQKIFSQKKELVESNAANLVFGIIRFKGKYKIKDKEHIVDESARIYDEKYIVKKAESGHGHSENGLYDLLLEGEYIKKVVKYLKKRVGHGFELEKVILEISSRREMCTDCGPLFLKLQTSRKSGSLFDQISKVFKEDDDYTVSQNLQIHTNVSCIKHNTCHDPYKFEQEPRRIIIDNQDLKLSDVPKSEGTILHLAFENATKKDELQHQCAIHTHGSNTYKKMKKIYDAQIENPYLMQTKILTFSAKLITGFGPKYSTKSVERDDVDWKKGKYIKFNGKKLKYEVC